MTNTLERVGNALCLDLVNTVNQRPAPIYDVLETADGLEVWMSEVGLDVGSGVAPRQLAPARRLREDVHELFAAVVDDRTSPARPLDRIVSRYAAVLTGASWPELGRQATGDAAAERLPAWHTDDALANLAGPVTDSALDLLRRAPLDRLRACPSCRWLFLDVSRNGQRRWCSMSMCGSRSKSAAYSARTRPDPSG